MLKKTLSLIVTFDETVQALAAEARLTAMGLPGRLIPVPRDRVGQTVGFLAGYQGFEARPGKEEAPKDRVLVFCEVDRETLDQVLEALKAAGAPASLKAILTGTNAGWPFARLARELSAEHRAMGGA